MCVSQEGLSASFLHGPGACRPCTDLLKLDNSVPRIYARATIWYSADSACMYVYMYIYMYMYMCVCMYVCIYVCMHVCMYACILCIYVMYVCYACMLCNVCMLCMYVMYVNMYVCMYVRMHLRMHACVLVHCACAGGSETSSSCAVCCCQPGEAGRPSICSDDSRARLKETAASHKRCCMQHHPQAGELDFSI